MQASNKYAIYIAIGKIGAMIAQFMMPLFLTRFLSKADYGLYCQFYLLLGMMGSILSFGVQSNLYYFFPNTDTEKKTKLIWNTFITVCILALLGSGIALIPSVSRFLIGDSDVSGYLFLIASCVSFAVPAMIVEPLATVRGDRWVSVLYPPLTVITKVVLVIPIALLFNSIESIFVAILLLTILEFLFVYIYCSYSCNGFLPRTDVSVLRTQLAYSIPFGIAVIVNTLSGRIDKLISIHYLSVEDYAMYSLAFFGIPGIMQVYDSLCQVNVLNMATSFKAGNYCEIIQLYRRFVTQTLSFSLPIIIVVIVFAPQIVTTLFSDKYESATPFFQIYLLTFIFGVIGGGTILRAIGRTRDTMWIYLISIAITLPLTLILIQKWGIWGGIASAVINTILPKLFLVAYEIRIMKASLLSYFPWTDIGRISLITAAAIFPIYVIQYFFHPVFTLCFVLGVLYCTLIILIEIKYNVFLIDKYRLSSMLNCWKSKRYHRK